MSVHSPTLAAQYAPKLGPLLPLGSINLQKMGNDWPSATHIIPNFLRRSCLCRFSIPMLLSIGQWQFCCI